MCQNKTLKKTPRFAGTCVALVEPELYTSIFIPIGAYDVLVCSGGFMDGHIPCRALKEMVRCVKQGELKKNPHSVDVIELDKKHGMTTDQTNTKSKCYQQCVS